MPFPLYQLLKVLRYTSKMTKRKHKLRYGIWKDICLSTYQFKGLENIYLRITLPAIFARPKQKCDHHVSPSNKKIEEDHSWTHCYQEEEDLAQSNSVPWAYWIKNTYHVIENIELKIDNNHVFYLYNDYLYNFFTNTSSEARRIDYIGDTTEELINYSQEERCSYLPIPSNLINLFVNDSNIKNCTLSITFRSLEQLMGVSDPNNIQIVGKDGNTIDLCNLEAEFSCTVKWE